MIRLSVIISTHNPHPDRLARTLKSIREQTLPVAEWETLLVDNASNPALTPATLAAESPGNLRLVTESRLGLSHARRRGFLEAHGEIVVMVDDDNVLASDYLVRALAFLEKHPDVGAIGGRSVPEFSTPPPPWQRQFDGLLALRDLGDRELFSSRRRGENGLWEYPTCSPIGAGMVVRRAALRQWLADDPANVTDRRGLELTSGGDNDMVFSILEAGWQVAYVPDLMLTHLIPEGRLRPDYLERLNHGIQKSWMQVLRRHGANPWPPISRWTVPLRKAKSWFTHKAWSSEAARIRWRGACGHFEGRAL